MSKMKTHKAIAKRFKITGSGNKMIKRRAGQDHFNSKDSGDVTRRKRRDVVVDQTQDKNIKTFIPYNK